MQKTERQDCDKIVEQLNEMVFECIPGRKHATFQTFSANSAQALYSTLVVQTKSTTNYT